MDFSTQSSGICTFCFIIQFLQCPFQRRFFSFLSVFDYCWAGATVTGCAPQDQIWVLQHKRVGPAPQSLQTCIWQHSGSTDLAQTANKSQPSQLHSFKSHYCSHSWLNSSASISNEKKEVQAALNNFQTFPVPSEHVSTIVRLLSIAPLKWWWVFFFQ